MFSPLAVLPCWWWTWLLLRLLMSSCSLFVPNSFAKLSAVSLPSRLQWELCVGLNPLQNDCVVSACLDHTPSSAFWHLPPNSARTGYAKEGALFISVQLPTDDVSALPKVWVLIRLCQRQSPSTKVNTSAPSKTKSSVSIQMILVSFVLA